MGKELDLQKLTRDAVQEVGGEAMIISHRFLVGVPDMLVKVPQSVRSAILEAKQREYPVLGRPFVLDVTPKQYMSLRDWARADVPSGVLSFLRRGTGRKRELWAAIFGPPEGGWTTDTVLSVLPSAHFQIDVHCAGVVQLIADFIEKWEKPNV